MEEKTNARIVLDDGLDTNEIPAGNAELEEVILPDGSAVTGIIGRVASPIRQESTTTRFYFWVPSNILVEKTMLVRTTSTIGSKQMHFYGVVDEVYRRSRKRSIDEEVDTYDGDLAYVPPFEAEGITFAEASILRTEPPYLTPPMEQSPVFLGDEDDAAMTYSYDSMKESATGTDWSLPIGLLSNGGADTVGVARIDLRDLTGDRAGHLNITGQSGHGTKSSFLLLVVRSLVDFARKWDNGDPRRPPFSVRPVIFNVKGKDLLFIDLPNRYLSPVQRKQWEQLGITPAPFTQARFYAPCASGMGGVSRERPHILRPVPEERQARPYYWTLADVIRFGLWIYLFSEESQQSETMMALAEHILGLIAENCTPSALSPAGLQLRQSSPEEFIPQSFAELRTWLQEALRDPKHRVRDGGIHTFATCRALLSRLSLMLGRDGQPIFHDGTGTGKPLQVLAKSTIDPQETLAQGTPDLLVIDIATLPTELRRFVVAAVLDQIKTHQMGAKRVPGQVYLLVLDELGLYAPRGARDPITRLFEHIASQLRSQGIILLGAQQHASKVSETIFGNSEFKVLGATNPVEIETPTWSHLLTSAQKSRALMLQPNEKMVLVNRGWMNLVAPFPAWAMKESEVDLAAIPFIESDGISNSHPNSSGSSTDPFELNLPEE